MAFQVALYSLLAMWLVDLPCVVFGMAKCRGSCSCTAVDSTSLLSATCKTSSLDQLVLDIASPSNVISLSLTSSNISVIYNNIFHNFTHLQHLNLSHNHITEWNGSNQGQLSTLTSLDVTGNPQLQPSEELLSLPDLQLIYGLTLNTACRSCKLVRNYSLENLNYRNEKINIEAKNLAKNKYYIGKESHCRKVKHSVGDATNNVAKHGYFPMCLIERQACFQSEIKLQQVHLCWDIDNKVLNVEYIIASVGLVLNITVVIITLSSKTLRGNVTLLLVANMAASDFLISLYAITLTSIRKMTYNEFLQIFTAACSILGFIWLTCQFVSIVSSVLVTLERFLVIVLSQKPHYRMTIQMAHKVIAITWITGLFVAVLPLLGIGAYNGNTFCVPVEPSQDNPHSFKFSITITLLAIVLYLSTIPLYVKIFVFVKANQMQRGMKKEGALAKKIATLVLSNMVFFFLPVFVTVLLLLVPKMFQNFSMVTMGIITATLPVILTSINAMCNPLLYAFRHTKFLKALKIHLKLEEKDSANSKEQSSTVGMVTQALRSRRYTATCTL